MLACTKESLAMVELLVNKGASVTLRNKDGWNPFHLACRYCTILYCVTSEPTGWDVWKS